LGLIISCYFFLLFNNPPLPLLHLHQIHFEGYFMSNF